MNSPNPYAPPTKTPRPSKFSPKFFYWCGFLVVFFAMFSLHFVRLWLTLSSTPDSGYEQLGFPMVFMDRQWPPLQESFYKRAFLFDIAINVLVAIFGGRLTRAYLSRTNLSR